jgi:hypothetical protein
MVAGIEYLPDIQNSAANPGAPITLEHLNRVYHPDIILLGVNASTKKEDDLKSLEAEYEIDLKIFIEDEMHRCILGANTDSEREITLCASDGEDQTKKIVNMSQPNYLEELYRLIIELFEEDGSLL